MNTQTPTKKEKQVIEDLTSLTGFYSLSKRIGVPMSTETVFKTIRKIIDREPDIRD